MIIVWCVKTLLQTNLHLLFNCLFKIEFGFKQPRNKLSTTILVFVYF